MKTRFLAILCCLLFTISFTISGKSAYSDGWEAFNNNQREKARQLFEQAAADTLTRSDALISLCLLDWNEQQIDKAFQHFSQFYETAAQPYPYLYSLSSLPFIRQQNNMLNPAKFALYQKILKDPNLNGTLRGVLLGSLGHHYEKVRKDKLSLSTYQQIGFLSGWQILGAFDNTSGSGFNKDWGVLSKKKPGELFKNNCNAEVTWFTPSCNQSNGWFYFDYHFPLDQTILYAQTYVNSPIEQDAYLRIGTSGSLKAWVNDALSIVVPEERNCGLDVYTCKTHLNKGYNRILIQIGQSEIDESNFMARLTDEQGKQLPGLTSGPDYQEYTIDTRTSLPETIPFFAEDYFLRKISDNPENPLYSILLSEVYLRNDKAYEATQILKKLQKATPVSGFLSNRLTEAYVRSRNKTDQEKEKQRTIQNDPESFDALDLLHSEAIKSEKYLEAKEITSKIMAKFGEKAETFGYKISDLYYLKQTDELLAYVQKISKLTPEDYSITNLYYDLSQDGQLDKASAILEGYCKKYYDEDAIDELVNLYLERGMYSAAMKTIAIRLEHTPYAYGYIRSLAKFHYKSQRFKEALFYTDRMLELAPYISEPYTIRGYIYKDLKMLNEAKEAFQKSVFYNPSEFDSRTQLRLLNNQKDLYDLFPKVNLNECMQKAGKASDYPQDNALIILDDNQLTIYPEGAKEHRYELAVKMLNKTGIEDWKEYRIGYNDYSEKLIIDKAEVIKADGSISKAETDGDNYIVFTNLDINDVLHLEYRIQNTSTGPLSKYFFQNFAFENRNPVIKKRYCLLVPKDTDFKHLVANGEDKPVVTDLNGLRLYVWESNDRQAVQREPYKSSDLDISERLHFSNMPDWKFISNWYKDLTYNKFQSDYVLKETVGELLRGKENLSNLEKAKVFYEYIVTNITYSDVSFLHGNFIPQKASRTITTRLGDCKDVSTLFVAMCKEAGIPSNLVLISTRNYGSHTMPLPVIDFNHCIAQLESDGQRFYLELTNKNLPFGALPMSDLHSEILPIPSNKESIGDSLLVLDTPDRPRNTRHEYCEVSLKDNTVQSNIRIVDRAGKASDTRYYYREVGSDEQKKKKTESLASLHNTSIDLKNLRFEHLDDLCDSVVTQYELVLKNAVQEIAGMKLFRMPWGTSSESMEVVSAEKRKFPFEFWAFLDFEESEIELVFQLPEGKKFMEAPKDLDLKTDFATFTVRNRMIAPDKLSIKRTYRLVKDRIQPEQYETLKKFLTSINEFDNKQYAIQ